MVIALTLVCLGNAAAKNNPDLARAAALNQQVRQLYGQHRYADAIPLERKALALSEKALGPDDPDVATILDDLAGVYSALGSYAEAELLLKRSLAISEKVLEPHDIADSLVKLAALYDTQRRYAEAEPLLKRSRAINEKVSGSPKLPWAQKKGPPATAPTPFTIEDHATQNCTAIKAPDEMPEIELSRIPR